MKKTLLLGIIALFALAIFSCDQFAIPQIPNNIVGYTADGRAIVELEINPAGAGRALHATLAQAGSDFYEVLFYDEDGDEYYRTSWREGRTARIRLPLGNYSGATAADSWGYIFAGRAEDMMLLAVGRMTHVNEVVGTTITTASTSVSFTVNALQTNVNKYPTTPTPPVGETASTFQTTPFRVEEIKVGERDIPVFMLNAATSTPANFDITGPSTALLSQIIRQGDPTFPTKPYAWPGSTEDLPIALNSVALTTSGAVGAPVGFPFGVSITTLGNINAGGKGGLCLLSFEFPVYLSSDEDSATGEAAKTWYLKGGLNNTILDIGHEYMGMGGSVLIGSGNVLGGSGLVINPAPPTP